FCPSRKRMSIFRSYSVSTILSAIVFRPPSARTLPFHPIGGVAFAPFQVAIFLEARCVQIFLLGSPLQIAWSVVCCVLVLVHTNSIWEWLWPVEGFTDELRDLVDASFVYDDETSVLLVPNAKVGFTTVLPRSPVRHGSLVGSDHDAPLARNEKLRGARHDFPDFANQNGISESSRSTRLPSPSP